jgi:hypothetical protein
MASNPRPDLKLPARTNALVLGDPMDFTNDGTAEIV